MTTRKSLLFKRLIGVTTVAALFGMPIAVSAKGYIFPPPTGEAETKFHSTWFPSDTYIVNDTDSQTLDLYLLRRGSGYEITIPINVRRYVGSPEDIEKLLETGLISETFKILIPAYDVDSSTYRPADCDGDDIIDQLAFEVNEVYFNDEFVGVLQGKDEKWAFNDQFELDIRKLNFPANPGEIGYNTIGIKIDVGNENVVLSSGQVGCLSWAAKVDWAGVKFAVASPVVFVAGLFGSPSSFENSGYQQTLREETGLHSEIIGHSLLVPSLSACSSEAIPSLTEHANQMREQILEFAERHGTESVHLIAHSKGGLDSRVFLRYLQDSPLFVRVGEMSGESVFVELSVDSLVTHGSPHAGSSITDAVLAHLDFVKYIASDVCDLTTQVMQQVNQELGEPKGAASSMVIGANADDNFDSQINDAEAGGNQVGNPFANIAYNWLRDIAQVKVNHKLVEDIYEGFSYYDTEIENIETETPQRNDTNVTVNSARAMPGARLDLYVRGINHGTIIGPSMQYKVIEAGLTGGLNWEKE